MHYYQILHSPIWFFLFCFFLITSLILFFKKAKRNETKFNTSDSDLNMKDIVDSIFKTQTLYKNLKRLYHPDRFTNHKNKEQLNALYQEMEMNKSDYNSLTIIESKFKETLKEIL